MTFYEQSQSSKTTIKIYKFYLKLFVLVWIVVSYNRLVERPTEAGGAPLGARLKLSKGDTRIHRMRWAYTFFNFII